MGRAETYEKAAEVLRTNGWHKGDFVDPEGGRAVCLYGACFVAAGGTVTNSGNVDSPAYRLDLNEPWFTYRQDLPELIEVVGEMVDNEEAGDRRPEVYNDAEDTTLEDILLVLKKATEKVVLKKATEKARESEEPDDEV